MPASELRSSEGERTRNTNDTGKASELGEGKRQGMREVQWRQDAQQLEQLQKASGSSKASIPKSERRLLDFDNSSIASGASSYGLPMEPSMRDPAAKQPCMEDFKQVLSNKLHKDVIQTLSQKQFQLSNEWGRAIIKYAKERAADAGITTVAYAVQLVDYIRKHPQDFFISSCTLMHKLQGGGDEYNTLLDSKQITDMSTTYHYNPLQITDKQISLIQNYIKSGNTKPIHILDTNVSVGRYNEMSDAFSREQKLETRINYAIKSQSNTHLLQDLISNGIAKEKEAGQSRFGMDAASAGEIEKCIHAARAIGIDAWKICSCITLSNPNMQQEDMNYALTNGVRSFVVHNSTQLMRLYKNAREHGVEKEVEIITRIPGPPDAKKTGGDKFGAELATCEAMLRFSHHVGMKPKGMAVHVGWQVDNVEKMKEGMNYAFAQMAQTFKNVKNKHGIELSILDLGGGWPNQFSGKPVPSISKNAAIVRELMDTYFADLGSKKPTLILEPGNYLSAAAGVTKANIINIDWAPYKQGTLRCALDAGMFNGGLIDQHYPVSIIIDGKAVEALVSSVSPHQESQHPVAIFGPSCDSSDKVIGDVTLSDNPGVREQFERMMEANNVCFEMLKELDSIDNSQKQSYIDKNIQKAQVGSQISIILHGTGAYTSEYNVGKVGERGFNGIRNPELVIISKGRVIEAGVSQTSPDDTIS